MSFFLLFLYTYANFLIKNGHLERIREKEQCTLRVHSIRNKREDRDGRGERRGGSRWVSLLTDGVSDSEPFLSSISTTALAFFLVKWTPAGAEEKAEWTSRKNRSKRFQ